MADSKNPGSSDEPLGMNRRILRRDFMNSTLLGSGGTLLGSLTPQQLLAKEDWTGYGGVGDYARSNGNTYEIVHAGHQIRDHFFTASRYRPAETNETFDCVVVGGGISGLAAALLFQRRNAKLSCLILENHPIFGGEAKRNEFIVDGQHLAAPQGSDHFSTPPDGSFFAEYYDRIGVDPSEFEYQGWDSSSPEIPVGRSFEFIQNPYGFFFGAKFGQRPGMWLINPWVKQLVGRAPGGGNACGAAAVPEDSFGAWHRPRAHSGDGPYNHGNLHDEAVWFEPRNNSDVLYPRPR